MKSKIFVLSAIALTFAVTANVLAYSSSISLLSTFIQGDARIQLKQEELPEGVKKALADDKYRGWEISTAFWVKSKAEFYEITLKKETDSKILKFDKDGKSIEEIKSQD